jgi:hypothetical protein
MGVGALLRCVNPIDRERGEGSGQRLWLAVAINQ